MSNPSTGEIDSIMISIDEVRLIDKKLVEYEGLKLEKSLWQQLDDNRITNINYLEKTITDLKIDLNNKNKLVEKQKLHKKFFIGTTTGLSFVVLILLII